MVTNALDFVMGREFDRHALEVLPKSMFERFKPTVGLEIEYSLVKTGTAELVSQETRDLIVNNEPRLLDQELGAAQIELKCNPIDLADVGFVGLEAHVREFEGKAARAAAAADAQLVRLGSFPNLSLSKIQRTNSERYNRVPTWHNVRHSQGISTSIGVKRHTSPATAEIIALMNSVQFNIATRSEQETIENLNISYAILPSLLAISGNSRFLDGKDTGFSDTRMIVWERTHDTRSAIERVINAPLRVGLPDRYFKSYEDYLSFTKSFPFILYNPNAAANLALGLNWSDARMKLKETMLTEFRPVSIQPSVKEDIAVCAAYLGLLHFHRSAKNKLPPMLINKLNRSAAMRFGLTARFIEQDRSGSFHYLPAADVIEDALNQAERGLALAGFVDGRDFITLLHDRLARMRTPSDDFFCKIKTKEEQGLSFGDSLKEAVKECVVNI